MLTKNHLNRYADVLLWGLKTARSGKFKKGDIVLVRYHLPALHLAEILNARLLEMGMNPVLRAASTPAMEKDFFQLANNRQLTFIAPGEDVLSKHLNGNIFLYAPESITHLADVDPKKNRRPRRFAQSIKGYHGSTRCQRSFRLDFVHAAHPRACQARRHLA